MGLELPYLRRACGSLSQSRVFGGSTRRGYNPQQDSVCFRDPTEHVQITMTAVIPMDGTCLLAQTLGPFRGTGQQVTLDEWAGGLGHGD